MPLPELEHKDRPDFAAHPEYQQFFNFLVTSGQTRDQAIVLLTDIWRQKVANEAQRQHGVPPEPEQQQHPGDQPLQPEQADQDQPDQPWREQTPLAPRPFIHQPGEQQREIAREQDFLQPPPQEPLLPQDFPQPPGDDQDRHATDRQEKRASQLPPIILGARSSTLALHQPMTYAIEKFCKFEYVPLWYFTEQGCQLAGKEKTANEDLYDVTRTSDNRLALRTATSNCPSPNAISDELLTWEQFMDASHLLCRWLIPAGWPEGYAKIISSFFWQIENHEDKAIVDGKETLLLYQAQVRKAWHNELKAGHFFDLAELDDRRLNAYRKEVDSRQKALACKAVSPPPPKPNPPEHS